MIRRMEPADLDAAAKLWLEANLQAHAFIAPSYWEKNYAPVREQLAGAEVYVWAESGEILGLLGLQGEEVAGLFVRDTARGRGIGRELLNFVKRRRTRLILRVYARNPRAAAFYRREGFCRLRRETDPATGEAEDVLVWSHRAG